MLYSIIFDLKTIDWNTFTAIGTIILAFITFLTIMQNNLQLKEMRRQWELEHSPDLDISIINLPYRCINESLAIEIKNFGKGAAEQVKLNFDKDFIDNFPHKSVKEQVERVENKTYRILPGDTKIIPICQFDDNSANSEKLFGQPVSDSERERIHKYLEHFSFNLKCEYNGKSSPFEHTFTAEEKGFVHINISSSLSEVADEIDDVRRSIDNLVLGINDIQYAIESNN